MEYINREIMFLDGTTTPRPEWTAMCNWAKSYDTYLDAQRDGLVATGSTFYREYDYSVPNVFNGKIKQNIKVVINEDGSVICTCVGARSEDLFTKIIDNTMSQMGMYTLPENETYPNMIVEMYKDIYGEDLPYEVVTEKNIYTIINEYGQLCSDITEDIYNWLVAHFIPTNSDVDVIDITYESGSDYAFSDNEFMKFLGISRTKLEANGWRFATRVDGKDVMDIMATQLEYAITNLHSGYFGYDNVVSTNRFFGVLETNQASGSTLDDPTLITSLKLSLYRQSDANNISIIREETQEGIVNYISAPTNYYTTITVTSTVNSSGIATNIVASIGSGRAQNNTLQLQGGIQKQSDYHLLLTQFCYQGIFRPYRVTGVTPSGDGISDDYPDYEPDFPIPPDTKNPTPTVNIDPITEVPIPKIIIPSPTPIPPTPPTPPLPPIPIPPSDTTGFVHIYAPLNSDLSSFNNELWDAETTLKSWFTNNPLDGIVSLIRIPFTPDTSQAERIVCGKFKAQQTASVVTSRYITWDISPITIERPFNDYRDYYCSVEVQLPCIGTVSLSAQDIIGSTVQVNYLVDCVSGDLVAHILVHKDVWDSDVYADLYQFNGNCAMDIPVSGANNRGLLSSLLGGACSVGLAVASGGTSAIVGASVTSSANVLNNTQSSIARSGSMTGNNAFIGATHVTFMVHAPRSYVNDMRNSLIGRSTTSSVIIGLLNDGYHKMKEIHVNINNASDEECNEIHRILTDGFLIN